MINKKDINKIIKRIVKLQSKYRKLCNKFKLNHLPNHFGDYIADMSQAYLQRNLYITLNYSYGYISWEVFMYLDESCTEKYRGDIKYEWFEYREEELYEKLLDTLHSNICNNLPFQERKIEHEKSFIKKLEKDLKKTVKAEKRISSNIKHRINNKQLELENTLKN
jgi:hypothetical protein